MVFFTVSFLVSYQLAIWLASRGHLQESPAAFSSPGGQVAAQDVYRDIKMVDKQTEFKRQLNNRELTVTLEEQGSQMIDCTHYA